jgi:hypothetical protein
VPGTRHLNGKRHEPRHQKLKRRQPISLPTQSSSTRNSVVLHAWTGPVPRPNNSLPPITLISQALFSYRHESQARGISIPTALQIDNTRDACRRPVPSSRYTHPHCRCHGHRPLTVRQIEDSMGDKRLKPHKGRDLGCCRHVQQRHQSQVLSHSTR